MSADEQPAMTDTEKRLLFDWYNHITTSGLIVIGGIIGFLPAGKLPSYAFVALALVVTGATLALGASAHLRPGTKKSRFRKLIAFFERHAHSFVAGGAGAFIGGFGQQLL
jgi:hypothetical protein